MRNLVLTAIAAATLSASLAAAEDVQQLDLTGFDSINAGGGYQLVVTVGETWSVNLEGDADDFDRLKAEVDGDELALRQRTRLFQRSRGLDLTVRVTMPAVEALDFHRGIAGSVSGIAADALSVEVSTGAEVQLSGTCDRLDLDLSTGGVLRARDLVCQSVEIDSSTGGEARVFASERAEASASTGASVRIFGEPAQREARSSMGGVVRFDTGN
ncbi:head GIN domain-containing protein [Maricaulis sp.]|uniref:head GIN domain-containing protein n=1 Tax=Maricaulis sp. TaxID=1486257 RepID=UPI003A92F4D5